jgi:hypothetical protein
MSTPEDAAEFLAALPDRMGRLEEMLGQLLGRFNPNPAQTQPPDTSGTPATTPNTHRAPSLRPNQPPVFSGDRSKGRAFLHAVRTYAELVPEAFIDSEEKLVRFAMSFMSEDQAQRWAQRQGEKTPFPFPTWSHFEDEFRLRFVEENEQENAMHKLESRSFYMGTKSVYDYTDDFEDLWETSDFTDNLAKVVKYRAGLNVVINTAITTSGTAPSERNYDAWRRRAFAQYEALLKAKLIAAPAVPGRSGEMGGAVAD